MRAQATVFVVQSGERVCYPCSSALHAHTSLGGVLTTATASHLSHLLCGFPVATSPVVHESLLGSETQFVSFKCLLRVHWMDHTSRCCLTPLTFELLYILNSSDMVKWAKAPSSPGRSTVALHERRKWCACAATGKWSKRAGSATQKSPRPLQGDRGSDRCAPGTVCMQMSCRSVNAFQKTCSFSRG